jgi:uncharacterized membrane protein YfcA/cephalosporin-C deacetylase-like acetyl esterase
MDLGRDGLLAGAAAVAGAVNAVAGGGTLISFPAAMAWGLPSTVANATNAIAMSPGSLASAWGYRRELGGDVRAVVLLSAPAMLGAVAGAAILHHTSQRLFDAIVPWLVLGATLLILFQGFLRKKEEAAASAPPTRGRTALAIACQLLVGVYGGYFGAAMGIVTLAFLSLLVSGNMHRKNAIKNLLAALVNGVASIYFVFAGLVSGRAALIMIAGAMSGGFVGARLARRTSPRVIRGIVVVIGLSLSGLLAWRAYAPRAARAASAAAGAAPAAWVARLDAAAASQEAWRAYRERIRTRILVSSGLSYGFARPAVRALVFGRVERNGYSVENVQLETWPGFFITGNVYRPAEPGAGAGVRRPAVLSLHGHWKGGRFADTEVESVPGRAITLARLGFVVLSPDMVGFGDLESLVPHSPPATDAPAALPYAMGLHSIQLWNNLRALDYLAALPDVDGARIGVTGGSSGGLQSVMLAAADDRVAAVASVSMIAAGFQGGCACENPPLLRIDLTNAELAAAVAPRPLLLVAATGDWTKDTPREVGEPLSRLYAGLGASDHFRVVQFEGPHNYNRTAREAVYAWLGRWLGGRPDADRIAEPPFRAEPRAALAAITAEHPPAGALDAGGLLADMRRIADTQLDLILGLAEKRTEARAYVRERLAPALAELLVLPPATPARGVPPADPRAGRAVLIVAGTAGEAAALTRAIGNDAAVTTLVLPEHAREEPGSGVPKHHALYPDTYFRRPLAWQVRDALAAIDALAARADVGEALVAGVGAGGPAALLARALAHSPKLGRAAIDLRAPAAADGYPGLARIGGLRAATALVDPPPLLVRAGESFDPAAVAAFLLR